MQHLTKTIYLALGLGLGLVQTLALHVALEDLGLLQLPAGHFVLGDRLATLLRRISAGAIESHVMFPCGVFHTLERLSVDRTCKSIFRRTE